MGAMTWGMLAAGMVFLALGVCGQAAGRRRHYYASPQDLHLRRWALAVASLIAGFWMVAFSMVHLLRPAQQGRW